MNSTCVDNVEDELDLPSIFDEYVEDDIQEVDLENLIFGSDTVDQEVVSKIK